jgi:hypothetical protein
MKRISSFSDARQKEAAKRHYSKNRIGQKEEKRVEEYAQVL